VGGQFAMQYSLTVNFQCDETRPGCQKCQIYGISCDYSAVQEQFRRNNLNVLESPKRSMSLSDLASKIDQALKLAPSSGEWSGTSRTYALPKILKAFHHFVTFPSADPTGSELYMEVSKGDMVRVAFRVC
jgi:hypothetical protein